MEVLRCSQRLCSEGAGCAEQVQKRFRRGAVVQVIVQVQMQRCRDERCSELWQSC